MPQGNHFLTAHLILSGFFKYLRGIQKRSDEGPHTLSSPFSSIQFSKKLSNSSRGTLFGVQHIMVLHKISFAS